MIEIKSIDESIATLANVCVTIANKDKEQMSPMEAAIGLDILSMKRTMNNFYDKKTVY